MDIILKIVYSLLKKTSSFLLLSFVVPDVLNLLLLFQSSILFILHLSFVSPIRVSILVWLLVTTFSSVCGFSISVSDTLLSFSTSLASSSWYSESELSSDSDLWGGITSSCSSKWLLFYLELSFSCRVTSLSWLLHVRSKWKSIPFNNTMLFASLLGHVLENFELIASSLISSKVASRFSESGTRFSNFWFRNFMFFSLFLLRKKEANT